MINFGQPRVGDDAYAAFAEQRFPKVFRQTHYKDTVPHVPLESQGFRHIATEVYEDNKLNYTICDGSGEDPHCAD